jgi:hypothetical protein
MTIFRISLVVAWIAVLFVTVQAVGSQGLVAAGDVFFSDLTSGTWHAQFGADFAGHLLLMAAWVAWRHKFSVPGCVLGVLCVLGGALVSFMYILVASFAAKGDPRGLLLGANIDSVKPLPTDNHNWL